MTQQEPTEMTQETDTLVPDDAWIDDEDGALSDDDPFADADALDDGDRIGEDEAEPPARARRRSVPPIAIGLSAVVIAGLGFIGGVQVQKRSGDDAAGRMPTGMAAMVQGGGPGGAGTAGARGGAGSGASGSSSSTTGEVANVKGSRVYVTTSDGTTVEVSVGKAATVQRLASSSLDEIRPGDTVVVSGSTSANGTVKATAVQATASGVSLLGGVGGRGGAPGASRSGSDADSGAGSGSASATGSGTRSTPDSGTADDAAAVDRLFESGD